MTLVVGFDTATEHTALALGRLLGDRLEIIGTRDFHAPRSAQSRLLPAVCELLSETGNDLAAVGMVVVGLGPGSFTGVRIGVAAAKGLAQGLGARLVGAGTLDAIAWRFADRRCVLGVIGDAMRGEVYPALFACGEGTCERLTPHAVGRPDETAEGWRLLLEGQREAQRRELAAAPGPFVVAGDGLAKYERIFGEVLGADAEIAPPERWMPAGGALLHAAHLELRGEEGGDPAALMPIYTRLSDAEEAERRRAASGGPDQGSGAR